MPYKDIQMQVQSFYWEEKDTTKAKEKKLPKEYGKIIVSIFVNFCNQAFISWSAILFTKAQKIFHKQNHGDLKSPE